MNLASKRTVKNLLKKYRVHPLKKLGQNFLINKEVVKEFIRACEFKSSDRVLEIGPGLGTLTQEIAKRVKRVIAVEKDSKMCEILKETLEDFTNIEIIQEDILKINPKSYVLNAKSYKVVGNLPFYLSAPVTRKFLEIEKQPTNMILMVQKEVGERICAQPPNMSILAVSVQFYATAKMISFVSKKSFWPQPKVDSAITRIEVKDKKQKARIKKELFFKIVKAGFAHPRKQLVNNLSKKLKKSKKEIKDWLLKNQIDPTLRAETLTLENWINLTETCKII